MLPPHMGNPLSQTSWPMPDRRARQGQYMDLAPLDIEHSDALWPLAHAAPNSFDYLRYGPFSAPSELHNLLTELSERQEQPFWAVVPKGTHAQGWLSLCDIYQRDGSIEIGSIWFAPCLQATRAAREAIFALMCHAMDDLGYERLVWRCQEQNARSFKAASRLGFTHEGTWRHAAVVKGWQRNLAWFSILKSEWPARRHRLECWLDPANFDAAGKQIAALPPA